MKTYPLVAAFILILMVCGCVRADEPADTSAPKRLSDIVKQADYVVLDFGEYGHPQEVKVASRKFIDSIAQVFAEATYIPRDHSLSISPALYTFYVKGKLRMGVSLQPGSVVRLSNADAEENFEISKKSINALLQLYLSQKPTVGARPMRATVERFLQDAVAENVLLKGSAIGRLSIAATEGLVLTNTSHHPVTR